MLLLFNSIKLNIIPWYKVIINIKKENVITFIKYSRIRNLKPKKKIKSK